ncbi:methyl-accepting chemotaxis protein [Desulfohalovibrio reitneri]|uniref:methyl-accepting chemotaxis protein n=1 Tax=Desulfohalovibrio reitneri TaxID=1307759 RepID=UPI0004A70871|nr:methyl-accepting chemotaxis protein [Desulfohalovibrio reitneri]
MEQTGSPRVLISLHDLGGRAIELAQRAEGLLARREDNFLELGSTLQDAWSRASGLAERAGRLSEATSGEGMAGAIGDLEAKLEELTGVCRLDTSEDSLEQLGRILDIVQGLDRFIGEFRRIVRKLQMLGISTRIESARLGNLGSGFSTLADDVEKLSHTIEEHSANITEQSGKLRDLVWSAREKTSEIMATQRGCSEEIIEHVTENLGHLREVDRRSTEAAAKLPHRSREMADNVGHVVQSMQFHDIVRQQIEHVQHALDDMGRELLRRENEVREVDESSRNALGFAADVARLQISQVQNAHERFGTAVETIRDNLRGVALGVRRIVDEAASVLEAGSDDGKTSVLERIEEGIFEVMSGIRAFADQGRDMADLMRDVAGTVSAMSGFVTDIEDVGSEIELIALNASVKAAHTGEEGAALGVLATSIQTLSVEARRETDSASTVLRQVSEASRTLQENAESYMDTSGVEEMLEKLNSLIDRIRGMNSGVRGAFDDLRSTGERLAGDVEEVAESVDFHEDVCHDLRTLETALREMEDEARDLVPANDDESRPQRLREMLSTYTMEAERDIYRKTFEMEDEPESHPEVFEEEGEFGDNVELF